MLPLRVAVKTGVYSFFSELFYSMNGQHADKQIKWYSGQVFRRYSGDIILI